MPQDAYSVVLEIAKIVVPAGLTFLFGMYIQRWLLKSQRQKDAELEAKREAARPKLTLAFDPKNMECVTPWTYSAPTRLSSSAQTAIAQQHTDSYVNVLAVNSGPCTLKNCRAYLLSLRQREGGAWQSIPTGGRLLLIWAFDEKNVSIPMHSTKSANVLRVDGAKKKIALQVDGGMPNLLLPALASAGEFLIAVGIEAEDAALQTITLGVRWNPATAGQWGSDDLWVEENPAECADALGSK